MRVSPCAEAAAKALMNLALTVESRHKFMKEMVGTVG